MDYLFSFLGGILAGVLNTLASSGSAVTLPLLVFLGLHPTQANATNRIGILLGALSATLVFHKKGLIKWSHDLPLAGVVTVGAAAGAVAAAKVGDQATQQTITVAIVLALIMVLVGSKRFLRPTQGEPRPLNWWRGLLLLAIGFWAGFIVLDSATYLLLALVLAFNIELSRSNAIKSLCLLLLCAMSVLVFWAQHELVWGHGLTLAAGSMIGATGAAQFASREDSKIWVYRLLVTLMSMEAVKLVYDQVFSRP